MVPIKILVLNIKNHDEFDEEDRKADFGLVEAQDTDLSK